MPPVDNDGTNQAPKCSTLQRDNNRIIFCHVKNKHFILSSDRTFKLTSAMLLELLYDLWIIILLIIITALKIKLEIENIYSNNIFLLDWDALDLKSYGRLVVWDDWAQNSTWKWVCALHCGSL